MEVVLTGAATCTIIFIFERLLVSRSVLGIMLKIWVNLWAPSLCGENLHGVIMITEQALSCGRTEIRTQD